MFIRHEISNPPKMLQRFADIITLTPFLNIRVRRWNLEHLISFTRKQVDRKPRKKNVGVENHQQQPPSKKSHEWTWTDTERFSTSTESWGPYELGGESFREVLVSMSSSAFSVTFTSVDGLIMTAVAKRPSPGWTRESWGEKKAPSCPSSEAKWSGSSFSCDCWNHPGTRNKAALSLLWTFSPLNLYAVFSFFLPLFVVDTGTGNIITNHLAGLFG